MLNLFFLPALFLCIGASHFEKGYEHHYFYSAASNFLGMPNITTNVKFRMRYVGEGFKSEDKLLSLQIDSVVQFTSDGVFADNPHNWDLTKSFFLRMKGNGLVSLVHFHPDDHDEAVLLKKALASTFSANIQVAPDGDEWHYASKEKDHLGELQHQYRGSRQDGEVKIHRHHKSLERFERIHAKTLHLDDQGTVHWVEAEDNVIVENRFKEPPPRVPLENEYIIKDFSDGGPGKFHANAKIQMHLTGKRKSSGDRLISKELKTDDLTYKQVKISKNLTELLPLLQKKLECVHSYENKSDVNRTVCVNHLRDLVHSLYKDDYKNYVSSIISNECAPMDEQCLDEKYIFIDIVARTDDEVSQDIIVKYVLTRTPLDVEGLKRALFHISTLEHPTEKTTNAVSSMCLGRDSRNHGKHNLTRTEQRACLTLGALARTISKTNLTKATVLMNRIEAWIHAQDRHVRFRRSSPSDYNPIVQDDHRMSKFVLIHSLGNAGLRQTLPTLLNYMEPNYKHSAWRRAAIGSLRHFDCHETAAALLKSVYEDDVISVKQAALNGYRQHPKKFNFSSHEENVILSKLYTYPMVARVRRGTEDILLKPLVDFLIALPEVNWKKTLGISEIGASFGLDFVNRIHLRVAPLQGFLRIDVHDKAFAEAHVGLLNYKVDILLIEACYRGHIEYNLNLLKDFKFDGTNDLLEKFDKLGAKMISTVIDSAQEISQIFEATKARSTPGIYGSLSDLIENIPSQMTALVDSSQDFLSLANDIDGLPWVIHIKRLANQVQSFSEELKDDAMKFYNTIADAGMIVLPFAEKDIVQALTLLKDAQKNISTYPRQGFAEIDNTKASMKLALNRIIESKTHIQEALTSNGGALPTWLSSGDEARALKSSLRKMLHQVSIPTTDMEEIFPQTKHILNNLRKSISGMIQSLTAIESLSSPFLITTKQAFDDTKKVKEKFETYNTLTRKMRADVQLIFGPKFHKSFPAQRRVCDDSCGCGNWPATTGSKYRNMPGIDLSFPRGWKIVMPVNGNISLHGGRKDEVLIKPTSPDFNMHEIIISGIVPGSSIGDTPKNIRMGKKIGSPIGRGNCKDEYFHLAIRRKIMSETSESCTFVDPSSYVDHVDLHPKWRQECKEFTLKHILQTLDAGNMGNKDFLTSLKELKKRAKEWLKSDEIIDALNTIFPDNPVIQKIDGIVSSFSSATENIKDIGQIFKDGDGFESFEKSMQTLADISKGIGQLGSIFGNVLSAAGVPKEVTNGFSKFQKYANLISHGFNLASNVDEFLSETNSDEDDGDTEFVKTVSDIASFVGDAAGTIGDVLKEAGVQVDVTDFFDKMESHAQGVHNIMGIIKKIGDTMEGEAGNRNNDDFIDTLSDVGSQIGGGIGEINSLLKNLGVSSDVTDVIDKIQQGVDGVTGIIDGISDVADEFGGISKHEHGIAEASQLISGVTSKLGKLSGNVGNFLSSVGVSSDVTNVFTSMSNITNVISGVIADVGNAVDHISSGNGVQVSMRGVSDIANAVGKSASTVKHFLTGIGVTGDVTNVLGAIEVGASKVTNVVQTVSSLIDGVSDFPSPKGIRDIMSGIDKLTSGVQKGVEEMKDILGGLGVSSDVLDTLDKVGKSASSVSGLAHTLCNTIGAVVNISHSQGTDDVLNGVGNVAKNVGKGAHQLNTLLRNFGVSGDLTDTLTTVQQAAGGVSDLASSANRVVDQIRHLSKPESLSDVIDGATEFLQSVQSGTSDLKRALKGLGVSEEVTKILENVQHFAGSAVNITYDFQSALTGLGIYGAKDLGEVLKLIGSSKQNFVNVLNNLNDGGLKHLGEIFTNIGPVIDSFETFVDIVKSSGPSNVLAVLKKEGKDGVENLKAFLSTLETEGAKSFSSQILKLEPQQNIYKLLSSLNFEKALKMKDVLDAMEGSSLNALKKVLRFLKRENYDDILKIVKSLGQDKISSLGGILIRLKSSAIGNLISLLQNLNKESIAQTLGNVLSDLPSTVGSFLNGSGLDNLDSILSTFSGGELGKRFDEIKSVMNVIGIGGIHELNSVVTKLGKSVSVLESFMKSVPTDTIKRIGQLLSRIDKPFDDFKIVLQKFEDTGLAGLGEILSTKPILPGVGDFKAVLDLIRSGTQSFQNILSKFNPNGTIHSVLSSLGKNGATRLLNVLTDIGEHGKKELQEVFNLAGSDLSKFQSILSMLGKPGISDFAQILSDTPLPKIDDLTKTVTSLVETNINGIKNLFPYANITVKNVFTGDNMKKLSDLLTQSGIRDNLELLLDSSINSLGITRFKACGSILKEFKGHFNELKNFIAGVNGHVSRDIGEFLSTITPSTISLFNKLNTASWNTVNELGYILEGDLSKGRTLLLMFCYNLTEQGEEQFTKLLKEIPSGAKVHEILQTLGPKHAFSLGNVLTTLDKEGIHLLGHILVVLQEKGFRKLLHFITEIDITLVQKLGLFLCEIKFSAYEELQKTVSILEETVSTRLGTVMEMAEDFNVDSPSFIGVLDNVEDLVSLISENNMADMIGEINSIIKSVGSSNTKQFGTILVVLGKKCRELNLLLKILPYEQFQYVGTFIKSTTNASSHVLNLLSSLSGGSIEQLGKVFSSSSELHSLSTALSTLSEETYDTVIEQLSSNINSGHEESVFVRIKTLLINLGPSASISLQQILHLLDESTLFGFGKTLLLMQKEGCVYLHKIIASLDESNLTNLGSFISKLTSKSAFSLSEILSKLRVAGTIQLGKMLKNLNDEFGSLLSGTEFKSLDGLIEKYRDITTAAEEITSSLQGSPMHALSNVDGLLKKFDVSSLKVKDWIEKLNGSDFNGKIASFEKLIQEYANATTSKTLMDLKKSTFENIQDLLGKYSLRPKGDKFDMLASLQNLPGKVCRGFQTGLVYGLGHMCIPDEDCLGMSCKVSVPVSLTSSYINITLRLETDSRKLHFVTNGQLNVLNPSNQRKALPEMNIKMLGFKVAVSGHYAIHQGRQVHITTSFQVCQDTDMSCLPIIELFKDLPLNLYHDRKRRSTSDEVLTVGGVMDLSVGRFVEGLSNLNLPFKEVLDTLNAVRKGLQHKISLNIPTPIQKFLQELFNPSDKVDEGGDPESLFNIVIFKISHTFGVGPIGIKLEFGAGGAIGMAISVDVRSKSGTSKNVRASHISTQVHDLYKSYCLLEKKTCGLGGTEFVVAPWISGMVYGGISVELVIARGGLKLIGYIMKVKFPLTTETKQAKSPVEIVQKFDIELIPIELQLRAWAKVFGKTVFNKCLWKWSCEPISWNVWTRIKYGKRNKPPKFIECSKTNSGGNGYQCKVEQVKGRHPTDTAFRLEAHGHDDGSDLKQTFAVGTYHGGSNVVPFTEFKGSSVVVEMQLPNGIPLYWTVKAKNSEGLEAVSQCMLSTYDNTNPDGRVEVDYTCSSHPGTLGASVMILDDSPLMETTIQALGYSPGPYGTEVIPWQKLNVRDSKARSDISTDLRYFSNPREGKLTASPIASLSTSNELECAKKCLEQGKKCISFDYEFYSQTCDLHSVIEGPFADLRTRGTYHNFERLDVGFNSVIKHSNVSLEHGAMYYINVFVTNTLGYSSVLSSRGTIVDFTPPEPNYLGLVIMDTVKADGCKAATTQRCQDTTWRNNHRLIIDGIGSKAVYNGHHPGSETRYTISNHYISGTWDPFIDQECGIFGYTWAVGSKPCETGIVSFIDPHRLLASPKHWTYTGYEKKLHLPDGKYYVTVQALNKAIHGGSLVTTVCHSTPLVIDTSPPVFYHVPDVMFDEDFDMLAVYYNVSDPGSGIARIDFGLGQTKHDIQVREYVRRNHMNRFDPYFVVENLDLKPGVPAWIRVRAVNNVELFASGHSSQPIMIDKTPPIVGTVLDGNRLRKDLQYQHNTERICAQWRSFYDPESGIRDFIWGVGTKPEADDVLKFHNYSHYTKESCAVVKLKHNITYYSTVLAFNNALNSKKSNGSSDGVLVDTTEPVAGNVSDGFSISRDMDFSSESATVRAVWDNFYDPESLIDSYKVEVYINSELRKASRVLLSQLYEDHSLTLNHLDRVEVNVQAMNGAELTVHVKSDGFLVDQTPPEVLYVHDSINKTGFQSNDRMLHLSWSFIDSESGIEEYWFYISRLQAGYKSKVWPSGDYEIIHPNDKQEQYINITLSLENGGKYFAHVTALNTAELASSYDSPGILIDITPPKIIEIHVGNMEDPEELDTDGYILHAIQTSMTISWRARDLESGIQSVFISIQNEHGDIVTGWREYNGDLTSVLVDNLHLIPYTENGTLYKVFIKIENKAGLISEVKQTKPIFVQEANVPGIVFDGRNTLTDEDYQQDRTSIAMTFIGFESEVCNIVGYEWAVGTKPYFTNILPYTDYGLVIKNSSYGQAQIHLQLYENQTYFVTVRARTGFNCHEEYIVSSSNGITLDTTPASLTFTLEGQKLETKDLTHAFYQSSEDAVDFTWAAFDSSGISNTSLNIISNNEIIYSTTSIQNSILPGTVHFKQGSTFQLQFDIVDKAGNPNSVMSPTLTVDLTPPSILDLLCTEAISIRKTLVVCSWKSVKEEESNIYELSIGVSSSPMRFDISNLTKIHASHYKWSRDFHSIIYSSNFTKVFVTFHISNVLSQIFQIDREIEIDRSPPITGSISITTSTYREESHTPQLCQVPWSYVEVVNDGHEDAETGIDRIEVSLGTLVNSADIMGFTNIRSLTYGFLNNLELPIGKEVIATAKIFNGVGLYSTVRSQPVVISPNPSLNVCDGYTYLSDEAFQPKMTMIGGSWKYSDPCPVLTAEWAVEDITGVIIQNFTRLPGSNTVFYNDEVQLKNGFTYISIIRVKDALNRTKLARSNGITVQIQPPIPGIVHDGMKADANFQKSTTVLAANWHGFGKPSTRDPTQNIIRYEVAVGNDRRFERTRSNVHIFVDVGLNTSFEFHDLNLTAKIVTYYITVRATSEAGGSVISTSNGIRVGYSSSIIAGDIKYKRFQSDTDHVEVYWSDFISDFGIKRYEVGIGHMRPEHLNESVTCVEMDRVLDNASFDVSSLQNVGTNLTVVIGNLSLRHNGLYHISVIAQDEAGICSIASGDSLLIDVTPPIVGGILVSGLNTSAIIFTSDRASMHVSWNGTEDIESGVKLSKVTLYSKRTCEKGEATKHVLDSVEVYGDLTYTFLQLSLDERVPYFVSVQVENSAGLAASKTSYPIFLDESPPLKGDVKAGKLWNKQNDFQHSTSELSGVFAVSHSSKLCTRQLFPSFRSFTKLQGDFDDGCTKIENDYIRITVKHDDTQQTVIKGGFQTEETELREGSYSVISSAMQGYQIVTVYALASHVGAIPTNIDMLLLSTENNGSVVNDQIDNHSSLGDSHSFGVGISVLGYESSNANILFWASDLYGLRTQKIQVARRLLSDFASYEMHFNNVSVLDRTLWDVSFYVNGVLKTTISEITYRGHSRLFCFGYSNNDFFPEIKDVFHPFVAEAEIREIGCPLNDPPECLFGAGFHDKESNIKEIWVGVSDDQNKTANTVGFFLLQEFCFPCHDICSDYCDKSCLPPTRDFEVIPITITNMSLTSAAAAFHSSEQNQSTHNDSAILKDFVSPAYYINVKVVNLAGVETISTSSAITIDDTPPTFITLACVDPDHSMDEPDIYQSTTSAVGAFWDCEEDVGQITEYFIRVGTQQGDEEIFNQSSVGLRTKVRINNLEGRLKVATQYFITVIAENSAGLTTFETCNITIDTHAPDVEHATSTGLFSTTIPNAPSNIAYLQTGDRVGVAWDSQTDDVEFYEWQIGSTPGSDDIFPRIKIGSKTSRAVAIVDGRMWLDNRNTNTTLAEYILKKWSNESIAEATLNTFFLIEPGRSDELVSFNASSYHSLKLNLTDQDTRDEVVLTINGSSGGLTIGELLPTDTDKTFGTAASAKYRPFIADLGSTKTQTSRLLYQRVCQSSTSSFFISPSGYTELNDYVDIHLRFNKSQLGTTNIPTLIYWDNENEYWRQIDEACVRKLEIDSSTSTISGKICILTGSRGSVRRKRSGISSIVVQQPVQIGYAVINKTVVNTPPTLLTNQMSTPEDSILIYDLRWKDIEGDNVSFSLTEAPLHGSANLSSNGTLIYKPAIDFQGSDFIKVRINEHVNISSSVHQYEVIQTISMNVTDVNDPPQVHFGTAENNTFNTKEKNIIQVILEANFSKYYIGSFVAWDVDLNDTLYVESRDPTSSGISFELSEETVLPTFLSDTLNKLITTPSHVRSFSLQVTLESYAFGNVRYGFLASDELKWYSKPAWFDVYVLINPCVHGHCQPRDGVNKSCYDTSRSSSFSEFQCACDPGYEGIWCQTETDECRPQPCPLMYDCVDQLNSYHCNINASRLMAILVCISLAVSAAVFICRRFKLWQRLRKTHVFWDLDASIASSSLPVPVSGIKYKITDHVETSTNCAERQSSNDENPNALTDSDDDGMEDAFSMLNTCQVGIGQKTTAWATETTDTGKDKVVSVPNVGCDIPMVDM